jgi:hypothetical protein
MGSAGKSGVRPVVFDSLQGVWDYDDIVGEPAAAVVLRCSREDTGSRVDLSVVVAAAAVDAVVAVAAVGVGVAAVEVTD